MKTIPMKRAPQVLKPNAIQSQGFDCGTACGRETDDLGVVRCPGEVLRPALLARIVERHFLACGRVGGSRPRSFGAVATTAGIGEVPQGVASQRTCHWNDMLDLEGVVDEVVAVTAVFTGVPGSLGDTLPGSERDVFAADSQAGRSPSWRAASGSVTPRKAASSERRSIRPASAISI